MYSGNSICSYYARWSGDDGHEPSPRTLIAALVSDYSVRNHQTLAVPDSPYGSAPSLEVGGTGLTVSAAPTGGRGTLEYRAAAGSACTVAPSSGAVTPGASRGTCAVEARWGSVSNYNPSPWTGLVSVAVTGSSQVAPTIVPAAPWGAGPFAARSPAALAGTVSGGGGGGSLEYRTTTAGVCSVNAATGAVTLETPGTCSVQVRWDGDGTREPSSWAVLGSLSLTTAAQTLVPPPSLPYGPSPSLVHGGGLLTVYRLPAEGTGALGFRSADESVCSVDAATGTASWAGKGSCVVEARWAGDAAVSPSPWTRFATVPAYGSAQAAPSASSPYGPVPSLAVGSSELPLVAAPSGGAGALEFRTASPSGVCSVDAATGTVTSGDSAGACAVEARWAGDATRAPSPWAGLATVDVRLPHGAAPSFLVLAEDPDPAVSTPPAGGPGAAGWRAAGGSACSVDASTGYVLLGKPGSCVVESR